MKRFLSLLLCIAALVPIPVVAQESEEIRSPLALGDLFTQAPTIGMGFEGTTKTVFRTQLVDEFDADYYNQKRYPLSITGLGFGAMPWISLSWDGLSFLTAVHYDRAGLAGFLPDYHSFGNNTFWGGDLVVSSELSFEVGPLSLSEKIYFDPYAPDMLEDTALELASGNVAARINTLARWDSTTPYFIMNGWFMNHELADLWFSIDKVFGIGKIEVGGSDPRYLRHVSLFWREDWTEYWSDVVMFLQPPVFPSGNRILGLAEAFMTGATGARIMDFNVMLMATSWNLGPVVLHTSADVPLVALDDLREWFQSNNLIVSAEYALEGVGTFDVGWDIGIGYRDAYYFDGTTTYYADYGRGQLGNNKFWLDAELSMVDALDLLVGVDFTLRAYRDVDQGTGAGTAADPIIDDYSTAWIANVGVEGIWDLGTALKGLALEFGAYLNLVGGKTYDSVNGGAQTFDQWVTATYDPANFFVMGNMTEQAYLNNPFGMASEYDGIAPLTAYLKASYGLNDAWSFHVANWFELNGNELSSTDAYFASAPQDAIGYYSSNSLELGAAYREGQALFELAVGWITQVGLPSPEDLGYTDVIAQAGGFSTAKDIYLEEGPSITFPLVFSATVSIEL